VINGMRFEARCKLGKIERGEKITVVEKSSFGLIVGREE